MDGARSVVAGMSVLLALIAVALSLLTLLAPAPLPTASAPAAIDLSLLITGQGAIGGPAISHLFDPQLLVARRGDTVRLRVMNRSHFRHAIEIVGYGVRTGELNGGESEGIAITADKPGVFSYRCYLPYDPATATCSPDHDRIVGHLVVIEGAR